MVHQNIPATQKLLTCVSVIKWNSLFYRPHFHDFSFLWLWIIKWIICRYIPFDLRLTFLWHQWKWINYIKLHKLHKKQLLNYKFCPSLSVSLYSDTPHGSNDDGGAAERRVLSWYKLDDGNWFMSHAVEQFSGWRWL